MMDQKYILVREKKTKKPQVYTNKKGQLNWCCI